MEIIKIILLIIGLSIVMWRFIATINNQNKTIKLFKKAVTNSEIAKSLIEEIDFPYKSKNYIQLDIVSFSSGLMNSNIGKFKTIGILINDNDLLIYTKCLYSDFDIDWNGKTNDVVKEKYQFFVLRNNVPEKRLQFMEKCLLGMLISI